MSKELVLVNEKGEFWTGSKFHAEYPEAKIYLSRLTAKSVAKDLASRGLADKISIFQNYGYDNEYLLDSAFKSGYGYLTETIDPGA